MLIPNRTIHGMVYNAMKLFMEINPQLFDDCSHEYTEQQNNAAAREALRERKWAAISEQAGKKNSNGVSSNGNPAPNVAVLPRLEEADSVTEDNQKRLDSLNLQDNDRRERRGTHERQNSAGSARGQQR